MAALSVKELEDIFLDVRKAYRLLYLYQRRMLDTVEYISALIGESQVYGYSVFLEKPFKNESKINFDAWAWDWLPMYYYEFFLSEKVIGDNNYKFAVAIHADNGFENAKEDVTASDVEQFVPVEESATELYFYVGKNIWKPKEDFELVWSNKYPREWEYKEAENDNIQFLSLRFPLSQFKDEDCIVEGLREFQRYCHDKGMNDFLSQEL